MIPAPASCSRWHRVAVSTWSTSTSCSRARPASSPALGAVSIASATGRPGQGQAAAGRGRAGPASCSHPGASAAFARHRARPASRGACGVVNSAHRCEPASTRIPRRYAFASGGHRPKYSRASSSIAAGNGSAAAKVKRCYGAYEHDQWSDEARQLLEIVHRDGADDHPDHCPEEHQREQPEQRGRHAAPRTLAVRCGCRSLGRNTRLNAVLHGAIIGGHCFPVD